ncbi:hypothetical protein GCM10007107_28650 [Shewanella indica]|nr:hypothetical protein GCM10007107_28650 [Shewanella indica]
MKPLNKIVAESRRASAREYLAHSPMRGRLTPLPLGRGVKRLECIIPERVKIEVPFGWKVREA